MKYIAAVHLAALALLAAVPLALEGQSAGSSQTLKPGDALRIAVWRNAELSADLVSVGLDGRLVHPLYQAVEVSGVPIATVRSRLSGFLARYSENPQFSVEPLYKVAVGGEVRQPGLLALPGETTLLQAVALAGGPSERGRLDEVTLVREGSAVKLDFTDLSLALPRSPIQSGDQLTVARRRDIFREYVAPAAGVIAAIAAVANIFR